MIVAVAILVLAALSVRVRRVINGSAMFVVCAIVWTMMLVAIPLESPKRAWRLAGVGALAVVLVAGWKLGAMAAGLIRHLP